MHVFKWTLVAIVVNGALGTSSVWAAPTTPPDAGLIYNQNQPQLTQPLPSTLPLDLNGKPLKEAKKGGAKVTLDTVTFEGNTVYSSKELQTAIGFQKGTAYDLAGLQQLANQVSQFYRSHGYTFASSVLPPQKLGNHTLVIRVIEGHYGKVTAKSAQPRIEKTAQAYLAPLKPGDVIQSQSLERQLLLLKDLPGVDVTPVLSPGQAIGTGDLTVAVKPGQRVHGAVSSDNYGSRYSGEYRGRVALSVNRVLMVGDELSIAGLYSDEDTWLGSLHYALPVGHNGLRAHIGYDHTDYQLGHGFEGYTGTADIYSAGTTFPVVRSQNSNVSLSATVQYKHLDDDISMFDYRRQARSESVPLAVIFDHRDNLLGGGVTWGQFALTPGKIKTDETDTDEAKSGFTKWNLSLSRLQNMGKGVSLYGHVSGQWADHESIDGSESFYLGGPSGVRAYPVGEGSDARGYISQIEMRYAVIQHVSPYLFWDTGFAPSGGIDTGDNRYLSGAGLGVRAQYKGVQLDTAVAWRLSGDDSLSDDEQRDPRIWFNVGYQF